MIRINNAITLFEMGMACVVVSKYANDVMYKNTTQVDNAYTFGVAVVSVAATKAASLVIREILETTTFLFEQLKFHKFFVEKEI